MASARGVSCDWDAAQLSYDKLSSQHQKVADAIVLQLAELIEQYPDHVIRIDDRYRFYRNPEPLVEVTFVSEADNYLVKSFKAPLKPPMSGFVSYSHKDQDFRLEFEQHVSMLRANGYLYIWSDQEIEVGGPWQKAIRDAIEKAGLAVLLVTPGFIASTFIRFDELPLILRRQRDKRMHVFWIPVADCDLTDTGLEDLQAACDTKTPLLAMELQARNTVLKGIVQKLRSTIEGGMSAVRGTP